MNARAAELNDLDALFDEVSTTCHPGLHSAEAAAADLSVEPGPKPAGPPPDPRDIFLRIGSLTRNLHDALRELGYDKNVERAVNALPDARARLAYIANLTGNAADRALGAAERGKAIQDQVQVEAGLLAHRWGEVYAGCASLEAFKATAGATREFLDGLAGKTEETNAQFLEVMMAQDFHDLTGQVINRIVTVAQSLEDQLVALLLDASPPERRAEVRDDWLSGPAIETQGRSDVVASQGEVDDLLESLGF